MNNGLHGQSIALPTVRGLVTAVAGFALAAALSVAGLLLVNPQPANAAYNAGTNSCTVSSDTQASCACPTSGAGVTCFGGLLYRASDSSCQADPRGTTGCPAGQLFSCSTLTCSCPSGTTWCSSNSTCVTNLTCPSGTTFNACTNSCSTPYVLLAPPSPQVGNPNITGNLTLGTDLYMTTGRAIRVDGTGTTALTVGNWGTGTTGVDFHVRGPIYGQSGMGSGMALQVGDDAGIWDINWGNGIQIRGRFDPAVGGLSLGTGGGYLYGSSGSIGLNTTTVGGKLTFANNVGSGFLDTDTEHQIMLYKGGTGSASYGIGIVPNTMVFNSGAGAYSFDRAGNATTMYMSTGGQVGIGLTSFQAGIPLTVYSAATSNADKATLTLDGTTSNTNSFAGLRFKHNVFTTGWGADIAAIDRGSFGTDLRFRVTPTGSANVTVPTERMRLTSQGFLGVGTRAASAGYPVDVAASTGTSIVRVADDSAAGNLWTGLRLDRGFGSEQWFIGLGSGNSDLVIRKDASTDVIRVSDSTGAVTINNTFTVGSDGTVSFGGSGGSGLYCSGPTFVGTTGLAAGNTAGSYSGANALCDAVSADSHVCTPDEIMRSIACGTTLPTIEVWVNNGAPGFTSPAVNDCAGWTTNAANGVYGTYWALNGAPGGKGFATACNSSYRYACCR